MTIYYEDESVVLHHGDCLDVLQTLPDASVDAVVTDPPYGLANTDPAHVAATITRWVNGERDYLPGGAGFMGKAWDAFVPPVAVWDECLRVLKPGGHVLTFAGTRTVDLMTLGLRLAGFEIRDSIAWLYGSGFPKSLNVAKAIASGGGRPEDIRRLQMGEDYTPSHRGRVNYDHGGGSAMNGAVGEVILPPDAECWQGWGTALRPSFEPVVVARKPLIGTVAQNVLTHGTGAINVDACRVTADGSRPASPTSQGAVGSSRGDSTTCTCPSPEGDRTTSTTSTPPPASSDASREGRSDLPASAPEGATSCPQSQGSRGGCLTSPCSCGEHAQSAGEGGPASRPQLADAPGPRDPRATQPRTRSGQSKPCAKCTTPDVQRPAGRWPANVILDDTHEPVLRLRYNLPTEVERTIRESFGASTDHLPAVRGLSDGAAEQGQASEVLLPQVPGALDVGEPDGRARSEVGQAAHAGNSGANLSDEAGESTERPEGSQLEGRPLPQSRVRLREVVDAPAERAGDLRADGDPQRRDVHTGAPASGRAATRAGADLRGDRASHQRTQGGQPAGEPGTPRVEQLASDEARRSGRRDVPATARERTSPGRPLEVLRRECPPGWWHYFEVVGHRREGQAAVLDEQSGERTSGLFKPERADNGKNAGTYGAMGGRERTAATYGDTGGASRFFPIFRYEAKAPASERPKVNGTAHPTVKPLDLMRWLVRLVTPPGGTVLEPFAGSGTTVEACVIEGFKCVAIEKTDEYLPLTTARIHRRRDPVAAIKLAGDDLGLFDLGEDIA